MHHRTIPVRPFKPCASHTPRRVHVRVITQPGELWKHHYDYALEQGNNHQQAERYAALMAR